MNLIILSGKISNPVDVRTTTTGKRVVKISIKHEKKFIKRDKTEGVQFFFIDIESWSGSIIDKCQNYREGDMILVQGETKSDSWEDRETGKKRYKHLISATSIDLMGVEQVSDHFTQPETQYNTVSQPVYDNQPPLQPLQEQQDIFPTPLPPQANMNAVTQSVPEPPVFDVQDDAGIDEIPF